jgi:hypothetical protein
MEIDRKLLQFLDAVRAKGGVINTCSQGFSRNFPKGGGGKIDQKAHSRPHEYIRGILENHLMLAA